MSDKSAENDELETLESCSNCGSQDVRHGFHGKAPVYRVWCGACQLAIFGDMIYPIRAARLSDEQKLNLKLSAFSVWNRQKTLGNASRAICDAMGTIESFPMVPEVRAAYDLLIGGLVSREKFWETEVLRIAQVLFNQAAFFDDDGNFFPGERGPAGDSTPQ